MAKRRAKRARVELPLAKEGSAPPAKLERAAGENESSELSVFESLPELVHTRIVQLLDMSDRLSLGATSRKMRVIEAANEFRRFARVCIKATPNRFDFLLHCPTGHSWSLVYGRNNFARYNQIVAFFKRAIIHRLDLKISGPTEMVCDELATIFRSVRVSKLDAQVTDMKKPFFLEFFSKLVIDARVEQLRAEFIDVASRVLQRCRAALHLLPQLQTVDLTWNHPLSGVFDQGEKHGYPIDVAVVRHLIAVCPQVDLGYSSKFTANDLFDFAKLCAASNDDRELNLITEESIVKDVAVLVATQCQPEFNQLWTKTTPSYVHIAAYSHQPSGVRIVLWEMKEEWRGEDMIIEQLAVRVQHLRIPALFSNKFYRCTITSDARKPRRRSRSERW